MSLQLLPSPPSNIPRQAKVMAVRRQEKKTSSINALRRQQQPPRAVAVAFRQRYDEHHNRGGDFESPVPPAAQDPAGDLSAPIPQRNSEPAVMSVVDTPVISALSALSLQPAPAATPASAAIPASAVIPDSTATPAIAENPIPRTMAPPQQYVQTGERAPKLSAVPSRQEVLRVMEVLLSNGTPFKPVDVVHVSNHQSFTTLLKRKFATDPDRRDSCNNWKHWSNQLFCRELNLTVPTSAVSRTDKLSFIETDRRLLRRCTDKEGRKLKLYVLYSTCCYNTMSREQQIINSLIQRLLTLI